MPYIPCGGPFTTPFNDAYAQNEFYSSEVHHGYYNSSSSSGLSTSPSHAATSPGIYHSGYSSNHASSVQLPPEPDIDPLEIENYLRNAHNLPSRLPVHLNSLPDPLPGERPLQTMPALMQLAIWGSPRKRLSNNEICEAIANRFQYYRERDGPTAPWRNTIRHTLSLKSAFKMCPRELGQSGRGQYWEIDFSNMEGNKRERKRGTKSGRSRSASEGADTAYGAHAPQSSSTPSERITPMSAQYPGRLPAYTTPVFGQSGFTHQNQQVPVSSGYAAVPHQFISSGASQFSRQGAA
uniref:Fork-head domain-containing protein n=1 Tax=Moniliophthora roreri TaxID=221103 RepID=A0A0W0EYA4_MONRR